jgi:chromosome segregation ATPase
LHAEIDQLEASIAKLTEDISELTKAVSELDAAMSTATKLRTEEKAKNTETISDSQEAQTAVAQALTVLKEFYALQAGFPLRRCNEKQIHIDMQTLTRRFVVLADYPHRL